MSTRIRSPRTNGFVERMNRTLLDGSFRIKGRTEWYLSPAEVQRDLDTYLEEYNLRRTHHGYRLQGRAPVGVSAEDGRHSIVWFHLASRASTGSVC